jgi:hypothetical protein
LFLLLLLIPFLLMISLLAVVLASAACTSYANDVQVLLMAMLLLQLEAIAFLGQVKLAYR